MTSDERIQALEQALEDVQSKIATHMGQSWGSGTLAFPHGTPMFPNREIHNLSRQSIDSTHTVTFTVDFDEFVAKLHSAKLRLKFYNVRSNVASSASAGGSAHTHAITPSLTNSGGSSHTHTISPSLTGDSGGGTTPTSTGDSGSAVSVVKLADFPANTGGPSTANTGAGSSHNHSSATTDSTISAEPDTGHNHTVSGGSGSESGHTHGMSSHTHAYGSLIGISTGVSGFGHTHNVTVPAHSHTISGTITASAETTHSHTISGTVTAANESTHTHAITVTYGIFEQAYVNPGL
ncbi:MAG TPA: hypothetical protein VIU40_06620, partial [Geobacteraceae bacterium]